MFDVAELGTTTAALAAVDEHLLTDQDLLDGVRALELARRFLDGAEAALLGELDARGVTDVVTGHRTPNWLARVAEVSPAGARARVNLARVLRTELPATSAALREGRLCEDRAKVLARSINDRIAPEFREMEPVLIAESANMTFDAWVRHVALIVYLLDQDGPPPPEDDIANNRMRLTNDSGVLTVTATLVGDTAAVARHAVEAMADELFHRFQRDRDATGGEVEIPGRETLRALAFAELCRRGLMVDAEGSGTQPKVEATLVINAEEPDIVYLDGMPLVRGSALVCDLSVWAIVMNSLGVPLDMGREIRTANREQRRALKARDGGCVFPGCSMRPAHCDAHHVAHWYRDLGNTDVKHMVYLCRHHHGVVHRKGWSISIGDDGWSWITTPGGVALWCQRHGTTRAGPLPNAA